MVSFFPISSQMLSPGKFVRSFECCCCTRGGGGGLLLVVGGAKRRYSLPPLLSDDPARTGGPGCWVFLEARFRVIASYLAGIAARDTNHGVAPCQVTLMLCIET